MSGLVIILTMILSVKEDVLKAAFVLMEKCCLKESVSTPLDVQVIETIIELSHSQQHS